LQPLNPFEQAAQHLTVGGLHVECEGNHVVDDHGRGQVALASAVFPRPGEGGVHPGTWYRSRDHAEAHVVGDPGPLGKLRRRARYRCSSCCRFATVRIVYSNAYDTSLRYFVRGGNWTNISYAGVLALFLNYSNPDPAVGFRVTR